jgi:hypothetical protein
MPNYRHLQRAHVWGCPVYVLDPTLQDGKKLPKWHARARRGLYVGVSPEHFSTVGRVLNTETGYVSPNITVSTTTTSPPSIARSVTSSTAIALPNTPPGYTSLNSDMNGMANTPQMHMATLQHCLNLMKTGSPTPNAACVPK